MSAFVWIKEIKIGSLALQKETKHSCSTSTMEDAKCPGCSQASCSYGQCDGHASTSTCSHVRTLCPSCATHSPAGQVCGKCNTAKSLALENSKTKCKLEQLRLVMQQKKQRRDARKLKTLPYSTPPKITSPEQTVNEEIETVA